jgi:hypothetical protein
MEPKAPTPRQQFNGMRTIWLALMAGPLVFMAVVLFLSIELGSVPELMTLAPVVVLGGMGASELVYRKLAGQAAEKISLADKLTAYQPALLVRAALLEAGSLLATVAYSLSHAQWLLAFAIVPVAYMAMHIPTAAKLENDLRLSPEDTEQLKLAS